MTVHVVHCIDTEGPLHEPLDATFARLRRIFELDLPPSRDLLRRLQAGEVDLGGREAAVRKVVDPQLLAYNATWDDIDAMLADALCPAFRQRDGDSFGGAWVYNWFCVDHVGYAVNPRRRDLGYHNVFDHYEAVLREPSNQGDGLHFHFHPHAFSRAAHHCGTHWWANSPSLHQILSRRVIERGWFPVAHRPGFHVERPESHWFLEQYLPFDFANQAGEPTAEDLAQDGRTAGRFGDWRRAPATWEPYHPAPDDYQSTGACRRWIARCLNVGTRYRLLGIDDVRLAFREAAAGKPVVLAMTDHDFRDLRPDVEHVRALLAAVANEFPGVPYRYSEAVAAMRSALALPPQASCSLDATVTPLGDGAHLLDVSSDSPTFGPQPWLALQTTAGEFLHDNFAIEKPHHRWQYVFDEETIPLTALAAIGIAANNAYGITTVVRIDPAAGAVSRRLLHEPQRETTA